LWPSISLRIGFETKQTIYNFNIFGPISIALAFVIAAAPTGFFNLPFPTIKVCALKIIRPNRHPTLIERMKVATRGGCVWNWENHRNWKVNGWRGH
jgi:hypothetical protein